MASEWGSHSLSPGASAGWFFSRPNLPGFLPVLQVMPLNPSFAHGEWNLTSGGYPTVNQLGISTIWSQLSDDLTTASYQMVVQNNSNEILEYAFLEADSYGPTVVPAPSDGLVSNSNYFLDAGGAALTEVVAAIDFSVDFASSANGYSFQFNCYSTEGPSISTEWQQFVIYASPNSTQLWARIDTWNGTTASDEVNRIDQALATLPNAAIPAGYTFTITLTYTNDGTGTVTGATYDVTDETGDSIGSTTITIVPHILRTTGQPATSANLGPIAAATWNIGGDYGGNQATLTSGAGVVTCSADNVLSVSTSEPTYTDFNDGTAENANLIFGPLADLSNTLVAQSFGVTTENGSAPRLRRGRRGRRVLPAPDVASLGGMRARGSASPDSGTRATLRPA
ncbi:MAG: hypothetical protein WAL63_02125 [Solirubrobacteraceae bacterium]